MKYQVIYREGAILTSENKHQCDGEFKYKGPVIQQKVCQGQKLLLFVAQNVLKLLSNPADSEDLLNRESVNSGKVGDETSHQIQIQSQQFPYQSINISH